MRKGPASSPQATVVPRRRETPTPRLLFSRGQKQREGLGGRTFEAPRELGNLLIPHGPRFLMEEADPNREAMPEFRRAFPGAPARCFPPPSRVWTPQCRRCQGKGGPGISETSTRGQERTVCLLLDLTETQVLERCLCTTET